MDAQRGIELRRVEAKAIHKAQKIIKSKTIQSAAAFSRQTQMVPFTA